MQPVVGQSLRRIVPPAMAEPNGRRVRFSTGTIPQLLRRTDRRWTQALPDCHRLSTLDIPSVPANELFSFTCNDKTFNYLEKVGTFDVNNPLELRDNATATTAFGVNGFNVPSLLSINYHA